MASSRTFGGSHFARNPSANSRPSGFSMAADMMRMGTSGFSSFISLAISVPVLPLRKWSAITNSTGFCLKSSKPVFSRVSGQHIVAFAAEQELSDTQRDVSIVNAQYERRLRSGN